MEYWGVDFEEVKDAIEASGLKLARHPFPDFDSDGLRRGLPEAAAALDRYVRRGEKVYLHCTAGMGRSPGIAIGYLYWFDAYISAQRAGATTLDEAYEFLTKKRPCGPSKEAIRKATVDLLEAVDGTGLPVPVLSGLPDEDPAGAELSAGERDAIQARLRQHVGEKEKEGKLPAITIVLGLLALGFAGGVVTAIVRTVLGGLAP